MKAEMANTVWRIACGFLLSGCVLSAFVACGSNGVSNVDDTASYLDLSQGESRMSNDAGLPDVEVCIPDCQGKECGEDGCGGVCGACEPGISCLAELCGHYDGTCDDENTNLWDGCTTGTISEFCIEQPDCAECTMYQPQLSTLPDGRFVLGWNIMTPSGQSESWLRVYAAYGQGIQSTFKVSSAEATGLRLAGLEDASIASVWLDESGMMASRFTSEGRMSTEMVLLHPSSDDSTGSPGLDVAKGGKVVTSWTVADAQNTDNIFVSVLDPFPLVATEPTVLQLPLGNGVGPCPPRPAVSPSGRVVVVGSFPGEDGEGDGTSEDIFLWQLPFDGNPTGDLLVVNSYRWGGQVCPSVACFLKETCILAWESHPGLIGGRCIVPDRSQCLEGQDGDGSGVFAKRIDLTAPSTEAEFQVSDVSEGNQSFPSVSGWPGGDFLVAWAHADDAGHAIHCTRFNSLARLS